MKELITIQQKLKAPKTRGNKNIPFKYRSCEDIMESVKPILAEVKCMLTVSDEVQMIGNRVYVRATATLMNEAGEVMQTSASAREPERMNGMNDSQVTGAASSYARKYALNGLFCIDDTKDADDAAQAAADSNAREHAESAQAGANNATKANGESRSHAAQKEQEYINQVMAATSTEEIGRIYKSAPAAFQVMQSRLYRAALERGTQLEKGS